MSQSPFKFLDSYTKDDREIFFGREREVEELYQKVFDSKILLIYGVSGTGKTSLINCGLANKFQDSDWLPISIRRGKDIVQSLADELNSVEGLDEPRKAKSNQDRILKSIRSIYLDYFKPIYLLFDQFEEIFIFGTKEERKEFALIIKSIAESDLSCKLLFSIREEYLASLTEMERYIPSMLQNRFRVERMNRQNAISVIEGPCKKFGISVEEGFPDALLDRLGEGGANIELTYLQVYLDRIYRTASPVIANEERVKQPERSGARRSQSVEEDIASSHQEKMTRLAMTFSISILDEIGDIKDLLGTFLNEQVAKMENPELANSILKSFVSAKGTKKQLSIAEATESVQVFNPEAKAEKIRDYIVDFVNLRILRGEDEEGRYELRHDSLAAKIFEKISADEMELLEVRQFIENAYLNFKTRQIMLSPDDFSYIGDRKKLLRLSKELHDFVDNSRENIRVKNRTVKRLTVLSSVAFVILILALAKVYLRTNSENDAVKNSSMSVTQFIDINKRLELAKMAYENQQRGNSREALIKAFNDLLQNPCGDEKLDSIRKIYIRDFEKAPESIIYAECTDSNDNIFGYTSNHVVIWNEMGKIIQHFKHEKVEILDGKISANEKYVALLSGDSILSVFRLSGELLYKQKVYFSYLNPQQAFVFAGNGNIVTNRNNEVILIDTTGNIVQSIRGHNAQVNALAISKSDRFIASAAYDTTIKIWYFNKNTKEYCLYNTIKVHHDTIWSVNFASRETYIITASKDSTMKMVSINGKTLTWSNENAPLCNSTFMSNDLAYVVKKYRKTDSGVTFFYSSEYAYKYYSMLESQGTQEFQYLTFSTPIKYIAYTLNGQTFLLDAEWRNDDTGNFLLYITKGEKPFFSSKGTNMFTIEGNKINNSFISADSIYSIIR